MTSNNLTGKKISLTYDKVVQVPDQATGILQDGLGSQVYTNSDSIGTIKMFYPPGGQVNLGLYFDDSTGLGVVGSPWEGWAIADSRNGTPNLKGRFIVGYDNADPDYNSVGDTGGQKEMPAHAHYWTHNEKTTTAVAGVSLTLWQGGVNITETTTTAGSGSIRK